MMTSSNTPRQHRSATSWKSSKSDVGDESKHRKAHRNGHLSIGQALLVSAMCASFAAVLTALIAVYCFSNSLFEMYSDQMVASTMSSVVQRTTRLRPVMQMSEGKDAVSVAVSSEEPLILAHTNDASIMLPSMVLPAKQDDGIRPNLAWLMSFPNRYVLSFRVGAHAVLATTVSIPLTPTSLPFFVFLVALPLPFT